MLSLPCSSQSQRAEGGIFPSSITWEVTQEPPFLTAFFPLPFNTELNFKRQELYWAGNMEKDRLYPTACVAETTARQTLGASPATANASLQHQNLLSLGLLPLPSVWPVTTHGFVHNGANGDHHAHERRNSYVTTRTFSCKSASDPDWKDINLARNPSKWWLWYSVIFMC